MDRKLDLNGVRIYSNTKDDTLDAMDLIGEEVYFSDWLDFRGYDKGYLLEVRYAHGILYPFLGGIEMNKYKYLILAKDAKFKDEKTCKIFRPYESIDEFCMGVIKLEQTF